MTPPAPSTRLSPPPDPQKGKTQAQTTPFQLPCKGKGSLETRAHSSHWQAYTSALSGFLGAVCPEDQEFPIFSCLKKKPQPSTC